MLANGFRYRFAYRPEALARHHRERLRSGTNTLGFVLEHIENAIARRWLPSHGCKPLFLSRAALGGESGVDRHVDMNRLVWDNRERLCFHVQAPAHPFFCIKDVIAWRKRSAVMSLRVRSNSRNLFFFALA